MQGLGLASAFAMMQARLSQGLPPDDWVGHEERMCRKQARDAEWAFRVSKGYEQDTFWNHIWFNMTYKD